MSKHMSPEELEEYAKALQELEEHKKFNAVKFFKPYPKQTDFFDLGSVVKERMLRAGNQIGKSEAGAYEVALHATGDYPDDWLGYRFARGIEIWCCGITGTMTRDVSQQKLFGKPGVDELLGTGFIPKEAIVGAPSRGRGATDAFDQVHVRHKSGGISTITFKTYEQGIGKFQGSPIDLVWMDEEPETQPLEIYMECIARTIATGGIIFTTYTPTRGITPLFTYLTDPAFKATRREVVMTMYDIPGITEAEINTRLEKFPAYQRVARIYGNPMQGQGNVFVTPEDHIKEATLDYVPPSWTKLMSIDFGIGHPFACVLSAWDRDNDVIHVLDAWRIADQTPLQHAVRMRQVGANVPVAWPQDGTAREKSGETVSQLYKKQGLMMLPTHATFEDGGYGTEAGILEIDERAKTGRLKINAALSDLFEEYRNYHRKNGLIVKERDDIMSAMRIGIMAKRFGRAVGLGGQRSKRHTGGPVPGSEPCPY